MSHFLRQFHLISSLKSNSERDLHPFYKVIAPILSQYPAVRRMHNRSIGKNMQLRMLPEIQDKTRQKPLAVILSWILAKDSHIEKYRNIYISRGFDVLTVNIAPKDILFPVSGTQVVAKTVLDYFASNQQYGKILVHAFSVGAYMMGEMFVKMREDPEKYDDITSRICGVILDSPVDVEGTAPGVARSVSKNPLTIKVLEWYITTHLSLMHNVATKHYIKSSKNFHNTPLRCPALMFVSEADMIGSPLANQTAVDNWKARGCDVKMKCWNDTKHVGHMHKHQDEYISEVDRFLSKVNLIPNSRE